MLGGTPPKSNIDTKNDALENISPFKHDVIVDIYVSRKTPGCSPVMPPFEAIKDRPQGDHVIATTRKSSESTKIIYSSSIEIVSHRGECSHLRVVSCGPWQLTPKSITCLLLLLPSSPALMALQTTMPQFLINISGRCRVPLGGIQKSCFTSSLGGFSSPESSPFSSQEFECCAFNKP